MITQTQRLLTISFPAKYATLLGRSLD